ncbi:protein-serine/threonine phosphatase [Yokenella regensburgei]|uniref:protein-serine/threonine phosphatase n=1 Tax=Yokenella regensburgei TaxID=158877 RepID=UPI003F135D28
MYLRIDGKRWRYIWIVGDVHGCLRQLTEQLREQHFDPWQDLLIAVGDLIDRGPESLACLELIKKPWFRTVRGNHEQMAMEALQKGDETLWLLNGGSWFTTLSSGHKQQAEALLLDSASWPLIIELHSQSGTHIIAHADYPAPRYKWQQTINEAAVLWNRERLTRHLAGKGEFIYGAEHFWFGHTPLKQRLDVENQHYIDTGAVFGGALTLVRVQ